MKKLTLLVLILFSVGTFAAIDIDVKAWGNVGAAYDKTADNSFQFGTTRLMVTVKSADGAIIWMPKMTSTLADFVWFQTMTQIGILKAGLMHLGLADLSGLPNMDVSMFRLGSLQKGTGLALMMPKIMGLDSLTLAMLGNVFLLDNDGTSNTTDKTTLAALAKLNVASMAVTLGGFYHNLAASSSLNGMSAYADLMTTLAGITVGGGVFWDLSDNAAKSDVCNTQSATKARQLVKGYVAYVIPGVGIKVWGSYMMDLNKSITDTVMYLGGNMPISKTAKLFAYYMSSKSTSGTTSTTIKGGVEFAII